ncbi:hypothetical protein [Euzebya sp.]|uniref:hypothetical protein n=1 Tax=Euzebya sp. TaxID=1971409 RepID=UPI00351469C9
MATYLVFARRDYPDPLELVDEVTADRTPTRDEVGGDEDWLELVVAPADAVIWIQRDGEVVGDHDTLEAVL